MKKWNSFPLKICVLNLHQQLTLTVAVFKIAIMVGTYHYTSYSHSPGFCVSVAGLEFPISSYSAFRSSHLNSLRMTPGPGPGPAAAAVQTENYNFHLDSPFRATTTMTTTASTVTVPVSNNLDNKFIHYLNFNSTQPSPSATVALVSETKLNLRNTTDGAEAEDVKKENEEGASHLHLDLSQKGTKDKESESMESELLLKDTRVGENNNGGSPSKYGQYGQYGLGGNCLLPAIAAIGLPLLLLGGLLLLFLIQHKKHNQHMHGYGWHVPVYHHHGHGHGHGGWGYGGGHGGGHGGGYGGGHGGWHRNDQHVYDPPSPTSITQENPYENKK